MKILLSNDDSIQSPGLILLAKSLSESHDVFTVAPRTEQSGIGQAITFLRPLMPMPLEEIYKDQGLQGFTVDGTPTDCVKLGLFELCPFQPDLVISGINDGHNAGTNVHYSGTVAGALASATLGVKSMALSAEYATPIDFARYVELLVPLIERLAVNELPSRSVLNINVPFAALEGNAEVKFVPVETNPLGYRFDKGNDPKGRSYFWANCKPDPEPSPFETDCSTLAAGDISVSTLRPDLNDEKSLEMLKQQMSELSK